MAAIPTDIEVEGPRNTRVNEIIAIALIALALLLGLCLFSYNPNDPSWNAAGEASARNWIGTVGANVAVSYSSRPPGGAFARAASTLR